MDLVTVRLTSKLTTQAIALSSRRSNRTNSCFDLGDKLIRCVIHFESVLIDDTDNSQQVFPRQDRDKSSSGRRILDPIQQLRRSTPVKLLEHITKKAAAVRRALKMAVRTTYKDGRSSVAPRKGHVWNYQIKTKTINRVLSPNMFAALHVPFSRPMGSSEITNEMEPIYEQGTHVLSSDGEKTFARGFCRNMLTYAMFVPLYLSNLRLQSVSPLNPNL